MNEEVKKELERISKLDIDERIKAINEIKLAIKEISPFKHEPVDCVIWVKNKEVVANEYNPNHVAPPRNGITSHVYPRRRLYSTYCCV